VTPSMRTASCTWSGVSIGMPAVIASRRSATFVIRLLLVVLCSWDKRAGASARPLIEGASGDAGLRLRDVADLTDAVVEGVVDRDEAVLALLREDAVVLAGADAGFDEGRLVQQLLEDAHELLLQVLGELSAGDVGAAGDDLGLPDDLDVALGELPRVDELLGDHRVVGEARVAGAVGDREGGGVVAAGHDRGDVLLEVDACVEQTRGREEVARGGGGVDEAHLLALETGDVGDA